MSFDHVIFSKYKLHHILFWAVYHFSWYLVFSGDIGEVTEAIFFSPNAFKFLFYVIFQALAVYFNLYYLMPKYLERAKFFKYITLTCILILFTSFMITPGYLLSSYFSGLTLEELYGEGKSTLFHFMRYNSFPSTAAAMTLAMSIKLAKNYIASQQHRQELEQEKLKTELKFLRSQFNPHFLFNTINSVFVLIKENPSLAQGSLAKFSELLRYQLYECNEPKIPLDQEIKYVRNFIDLETLRQNENIKIEENFSLEGHGQLIIAPFLLMPFIENAFKHVHYGESKDSSIKIDMRVKDNELTMHVSNSFYKVPKAQNLVDYGGIGLRNVRRRLELLYPGNHKLEVQEVGAVYNSHISISLEYKVLLEPVLV